MSVVDLKVVEDRLANGALLRVDGGVALTQWRLLRDDGYGPVVGLLVEWVEDEQRRRLYFPSSSLATAVAIQGGWKLLGDDGCHHDVECMGLQGLSGTEARLVLALYYAEGNALGLWRACHHPTIE